ncbi:class I SAM-dependent methyltransferase [Leucothrix sargassi]|nr:class I SAM-dependent methyltransferase [Leucothrix sargassi]
MSDIKNSKESAQNSAKSWDQEVRSLWPESYPESLSSAFKKLGVSSILDCAGGTGFPSLILKKMGWDVSYSDASTFMMDYCKQQADAQAISIPMYQSRWETLSQNIPHTYDALMCTGNSITNINSYDNDYPLTLASVKTQTQLAMNEFYKMLNTGGVLYLDFYNQASAMPEKPYSVATENETHRIFRTISYDPVRHIRTNLTTTSSLSGDYEDDNVSKTIPLSTENMIEFLLNAGFSRVERATTDDADYVDSFFAFK